MSYADLAELKAYLRIPADDTVDDAELQDALDTATSLITVVCGRTFNVAGGPVTVYRLPYRDSRSGRWRVPMPDLQDSTGLTVQLWDPATSDYTVTVDDPFLGPYPTGTPVPWQELLLPADSAVVSSGYGYAESDADYVKLTGLFGWTEVPAAVRQACKIQAARIFKRRESPFGMVNTLDGSEQARLTRVLDPDVVTSLRGFILYWGAR